MDVVYLCRQGPNEELRYSLRSLRNLPHDRVWVAGAAPKWLMGEVLPVPRKWTVFEQTSRGLLAAVEHPDVSETFMVFNDDFFVMRDLRSLPVLHRGLVRAHRAVIRPGRYARALDGVANWLERRGYDSPLSYELHVPMAMTKAGVRAVFELDAPAEVLHTAKRTLYGNLHAIGGALMADVKVKARNQPFPTDAPFLSTNDYVFRAEACGRYIRERFTEPSEWEAA